MKVDPNYTPAALFPGNQDAASDPKCVSVAEVIQQIAAKNARTSANQEQLRKDAQARYQYLSESEQLELWFVKELASLLLQKGVSSEAAKRYYSFRLSEEDAIEWTVQQIHL